MMEGGQSRQIWGELRLEMQGKQWALDRYKQGSSKIPFVSRKTTPVEEEKKVEGRVFREQA